MTEQEYKDIIVYLKSRIEQLEERKLCECETPKDMKPEYKATPREMFETNYDEDDTCLTCSA